MSSLGKRQIRNIIRGLDFTGRKTLWLVGLGIIIGVVLALRLPLVVS